MSEINLPNAAESEEPDLPRQPLVEDAPDVETTQFGRAPIGQPRNLDADMYIQEYPDMKLMWINDIGGDIQRWLNAGAEPVPRMTRASKTFKGLNDRENDDWVRAVGGDDGSGNSFDVYLLMIDPEIYDRVQLAPERERQEAIQRAMRNGRGQSDEGSSVTVPGGGRIDTYAPNLPTGGQGMDVKR